MAFTLEPYGKQKDWLRINLRSKWNAKWKRNNFMHHVIFRFKCDYVIAREKAKQIQKTNFLYAVFKFLMWNIQCQVKFIWTGLQNEERVPLVKEVCWTVQP